MAASSREQAAAFLRLARQRRDGFRAAERRLVEQASALVAGREGAR
jgi:hypothetical protein